MLIAILKDTLFFFWKYKNNSMSSSEDALTTIEIPAVHEFSNTK